MIQKVNPNEQPVQGSSGDNKIEKFGQISQDPNQNPSSSVSLSTSGGFVIKNLQNFVGEHFRGVGEYITSMVMLLQGKVPGFFGGQEFNKEQLADIAKKSWGEILQEQRESFVEGFFEILFDLSSNIQKFRDSLEND